MKSLARLFLWSAVFVLMLAILDQFLVRVPLRAPLLAQGREFYLGFRERILHRPPAPPHPGDPSPSHRPPRPSPEGPRYVYVDGEGSIQFADTLEEVPRPFRKEARPLER